MIVDEQHDLQKAKESVYILERGLLIKLIKHVKFPLTGNFQEIVLESNFAVFVREVIKSAHWLKSYSSIQNQRVCCDKGSKKS